mmetsp:Transcript_8414/g.20552  ORF Transcript_8414/g.20552 Transcript_8414/m.20552 type:complete len:376 (+) Transcript_8414:233-1360(+)
MERILAMDLDDSDFRQLGLGHDQSSESGDDDDSDDFEEDSADEAGGSSAADPEAPEEEASATPAPRQASLTQQSGDTLPGTNASAASPASGFGSGVASTSHDGGSGAQGMDAGVGAPSPQARKQVSTSQQQKEAARPEDVAELDSLGALELFARQPLLLSLTIRRPGKGELGSLAWRASELDVDCISEGNSIVLTKSGPGPYASGGSGAGGKRKGGTHKPGLAAQDPEAMAMAWKGTKKTMPKHLKKQLKAARRIRVQELEFQQQQRLLREVLANGQAMQRGVYKGGRHGARDKLPGHRNKGGGGAARGPDPAAQLTTTRHLEAIGEDNKGHQLLRAIGWNGGSLGATGDGLSTPITVDVRRGRRGLGHDVPTTI